MAQGRFTAQVSEQVAGAKALMLAVRNEAVQRTIEIAQTPVAKGGNMPVDTGFLRASGVATTGAVPGPGAAEPVEGKSYTWDTGAVALVIAGADLQDIITFAYTANYARPQEYGARGRQGRRFVGLAAQQWQRTVSEVVTEAKGRAR